METFSALLTICAGNSPVTGEFPHKGQWRGALMSSLICAWINGWVNNREAGDLRRHRTHYDVSVMYHPDVAISIAKLGTCLIMMMTCRPLSKPMMTSYGNAFRILALWENPTGTDDFPHKGSIVRDFDAFFYVSLDKCLNKQSSWWWFRTPRRWCDR